MLVSGSPKYEPIRDIGCGNFGLVRLEKNKTTGELVAIKYIERGEKVSSSVGREIVCHRLLRHPHIVLFKELLLTPTHLAIVMEYAAGGELFQRICKATRFREDEARYYFQQLIAAVSFCHSQHVCHRDLKLENVLLDESLAPRLKLCDFGYSKSGHHHSAPRSAVGTPAYIAPEVFAQKEYDGRAADVWSCGVTLYTMLVGAYPFEDLGNPGDFRKAIVKIISADWNPMPEELGVSAECKDLLKRIFVASPAYRISIADLAAHPWFRKNFPSDLQMGAAGALPHPPGLQTLDEINRLIEEARKKGTSLASGAGVGGANGRGGAGDGVAQAAQSAYMANTEEPEDDYMYYI